MLNLFEKRLQLVFLPLQTPDPTYADYYRKAVQCWEEVWLNLYTDHKVDRPLYLDAMLRQTEAACIFTPDTCVGMLLFRTVDFSIFDYRRDSYFQDWNDQDLEMLLNHGKRVFTSTFLTVQSQFRKIDPDYKFKELLLNVMVKRFLAGSADVISGVTRRDRGIHDESYKLGATSVRENVEYMDGRFHVDLVAFYRNQVKESPNARVRELTDSLWGSRLDLSVSPTQERLKVA